MNDTTGFMAPRQWAEWTHYRYLVREVDRVDNALVALELSTLASGAMSGDFQLALQFRPRDGGPMMRAVLQ